jgi:hypothetical protein
LLLDKVRVIGRAVGGVPCVELLERTGVVGVAAAAAEVHTGDSGGVAVTDADNRETACVLLDESMGVMAVGDATPDAELAILVEIGPIDGTRDDRGEVDGTLEVATLATLVAVPVVLALLEPPDSRCRRAKRSLELLRSGRS